MDVRELRIGNYVHNNVESFPIKAKDLMFLLAFDNEHYAQPIPLTEEWLLKLGFTKLWHMNKFQYSMYISNSLNIEVQFFDEILLLELACTNDNDDLNFDVAFFTTMLEVKCNFVHQLQNLYYSLTGQELTIK